jgi:S-adenosylmethionine:tRNA ribosyltransferase-isomerase
MTDLPEYLRAGDLLVFNDTRVVAARVVGSKPSGGRVEIFLERAGRGREALVQLRASKPIREGLEITTAGGVVRVLGREGELWRVEVPGSVASERGGVIGDAATPAEPADALAFFETWGEVPLPPYIHRAADASDRERYQSIFAREKGAVAAPTASLHFDAELVERLAAMGVGRAFVTLHVGAGTFQPLRTDNLEEHKMHGERASVSRGTWEAIQRTRAAGGRVVAVGTTVVRALESAALAMCGADNSAQGRATEERGGPGVGERTGLGEDAEQGTAWSGETRLFIRPGFEFQVVDAMITNFHLPESTLLMLVSAFAGRENVLSAYAHAVRKRYRFFSYGDAMLVTPTRATPGPTTTRPNGTPSARKMTP